MVQLDGKEFYGIGEVAKVLGVHRDTVRRWVKKAKIKAYTFPGSTRRHYVLDELQGLIKIK